MGQFKTSAQRFISLSMLPAWPNIKDWPIQLLQWKKYGYNPFVVTVNDSRYVVSFTNKHIEHVYWGPWWLITWQVCNLWNIMDQKVECFCYCLDNSLAIFDLILKKKSVCSNQFHSFLLYSMLEKLLNSATYGYLILYILKFPGVISVEHNAWNPCPGHFFYSDFVSIQHIYIIFKIHVHNEFHGII